MAVGGWVLRDKAVWKPACEQGQEMVRPGPRQGVQRLEGGIWGYHNKQKRKGPHSEFVFCCGSWIMSANQEENKEIANLIMETVKIFLDGPYQGDFSMRERGTVPKPGTLWGFHRNVSICI